MAYSRSAERRFYLAFVLLIFGAVLLGFGRTFFLRPWFPEWVELHAPKEPFFLLHGVIQHDLYHAGQIALLKKA